MLGSTFRFSVQNQTGVTCDIGIRWQPWKFNSTGQIEFGGGGFSQILGVTSSNNWALDSFGTTNFDGWLGAEVLLTVTPAASVTNSGSTNVTLQLQRSPDDGTSWPDDGRAERIGFFNIPSGSTPTVWQVSIDGA